MIRFRRIANLVLLSSAVGLVASSPRVEAGPNANAKILLHLLAPTTKNACTRAEALPPCSEIVTNGELYPATYFAYVLVTDADSAAGVAGLQFGIDYTGGNGVGVDVFDWTLCATLEFPTATWPDPGSGSLITWDRLTSCQRSTAGGAEAGVVTLAGFFYCAAYSADTLSITRRPVDNLAALSSCNLVADTLESSDVLYIPSSLGSAIFSSDGIVSGHNPCGLEFVDSGVSTSVHSQSGALSSMYDPVTRPVTFPHTITLAQDKWLSFAGVLYAQGSQVEFELESTTNTLLANGVPWGSPVSRQGAMDHSSEGRYLRAAASLIMSYRQQGVHDPLEQVLDSLGTSLLAPGESTRLSGDLLHLRFQRNPAVWEGIVVRLSGSDSRRTLVRPMARAKAEVDAISRLLTSSRGSVFYAHSEHGGEVIFTGRPAHDAYRIVDAYLAGGQLTGTEYSEARELGIESILASIRRRQQ